MKSPVSSRISRAPKRATSPARVCSLMAVTRPESDTNQKQFNNTKNYEINRPHTITRTTELALCHQAVRSGKKNQRPGLGDFARCIAADAIEWRPATLEIY